MAIEVRGEGRHQKRTRRFRTLEVAKKYKKRSSQLRKIRSTYKKGKGRSAGRHNRASI